MLARSGCGGMPRGCTSGGCGVCKVRVTQGAVTSLGGVSRAQLSELEEMDGLVLGCRVTPLSAVRVELVGKLKFFLNDRSL